MDAMPVDLDLFQPISSQKSGTLAWYHFNGEPVVLLLVGDIEGYLS